MRFHVRLGNCAFYLWKTLIKAGVTERTCSALPSVGRTAPAMTVEPTASRTEAGDNEHRVSYGIDGHGDEIDDVLNQMAKGEMNETGSRYR